MRGRVPANCVGITVLALALLGGACGQPVVHPTTTGSESPGRSPTASSDAEIAEAVEFRKRYGLRADDGWVPSVAADPAAQEALAEFGVPLMPFERLDLLRRRTDRDLFLQVAGYGSLFPEDYAGAYLDRARGGAVVASFSRAERHRTALLNLLPEGAAVIVEEVEWSSKELEQFVLRVDAARAWFRTIGVVYLTSGRRITENNIYVSYSGSENAAAVIEAHYGDPSWLKAEREGPLPWLGPRGDLVIVVTDPGGRPIAQLWCDLASDDQRVKLGGETPITTDRNGQCTFRNMPAVAYRLTLRRFVDDEHPEAIHHVRAVVDQAVTIVRIVLP